MPEYIGNFEILDKVGKGGFGTVYKARNNIGRIVALKKINKQDDALMEAQIMAKLEHPSIVQVYNWYPDINCIEMEYLAGGNLAQRIARGALPCEQALQIIMDILAGIEYAHAQGCIHRDLKPANILFDEAGKAKITDFGLAKLVENEISKIPAEIKKMYLRNSVSSDGLGISEIFSRSEICGTIPYMAPEQFDGHAAPQSDLYPIGLMLYEMLIGSLPFGPFPKMPSQINKKIPAAIDDIIKNSVCLIADRYKSTENMLTDLTKILNRSNNRRLMNHIKPIITKHWKKIAYPVIGLGGMMGLAGVGYGGYYLINQLPRNTIIGGVTGGLTGMMISLAAITKRGSLDEIRNSKEKAAVLGIFGLGGLVVGMLFGGTISTFPIDYYLTKGIWREVEQLDPKLAAQYNHSFIPRDIWSVLYGLAGGVLGPVASMLMLGRNRQKV